MLTTSDMPKIGIAVCSFNRREILLKTLMNIKVNTSVDYDLVVSDDGSSDGTYKMLAEMGVECITGENRGIAWNKNRVIFYLKHTKKSDVIILLEDDTYPTNFAWELDWITATVKWGHINLAANHWPKNFSYGKGTPENPYRSAHVSAQCAGFSVSALDEVGYLDSRFRSYGMEHVEHSTRFVKAGFGGICSADHKNLLLFNLISSDLSIGLIDENLEKQVNNKNVDLFFKLLKEPVFRMPWSSSEERIVFLGEQDYSIRHHRSRFFSLKDDADRVLMYHRNLNDFVFTKNEDVSQNQSEPVLFYHDLFGLRGTVGADIDSNFIRFNDERPELTNEIFNASLFSISFHQERGMFLKENGRFLTCDKLDKYRMRLNRDTPDLWETMYFHSSTFAKLSTHGLPCFNPAAEEN